MNIPQPPVKASHMLTGWDALRKVLNWDLPIALHTITAINKANLRNR